MVEDGQVKTKKPTFAGELAKRLKEREELVQERKIKREMRKYPSLYEQPKPKEKVIQPVKMTDWKYSKLRDKVISQGNCLFNPEKDPNYFREDDIDYMINMLRCNVKNFSQLPLLQPIYMKAMLTLKLLFSDENLCLPEVYDKLQSRPQTEDLTPEQVMKLLLRCRQLMDCRGRIIRILQIINTREDLLRQLNLFVIKGNY